MEHTGAAKVIFLSFPHFIHLYNGFLKFFSRIFPSFSWLLLYRTPTQLHLNMDLGVISPFNENRRSRLRKKIAAQALEEKQARRSPGI